MYKIKFLNGSEKEFQILSGANLYRANLYEANLSEANLSGANLYRANLSEANLSGANLSGADLSGADLSKANLYRANLSGADLYGANLSGADLSGAYLSWADLSWADFFGTNLSGANLSGANLPNYKILPEEGSFIGWKKTTKGIIKILIMEDSERVSTLVGRKCRASKIQVIDGPGCGGTGPIQGGIIYDKGAIIESEIDMDIRVECTRGIHFFLTEKEAKEF